MEELGNFLKKGIKVKLILLSIFVGIFGLFIVIIGGMFSILMDDDDDDNNTAFTRSSHDCGFSISSTTLSKSEYKQKIQEYANSHPQWQIFVENADEVYEEARKIGVNPELIVTVAMKENKGNVTVGQNNYWGLNCLNGREADTCNSYTTFMDGARDLMNSAARYDSLYDWFANGHYSYIGYFWYSIHYDPSSADGINWGIGGCAYAPYIYPDGLPDRVAKACGSNAPFCSVMDNENDEIVAHNQALAGANPRSNCTVTTDEDQEAYAWYNIKSTMGNTREIIFGLKMDDGSCSQDTDDTNSMEESLEDQIDVYMAHHAGDNGNWSIFVKNLKNRVPVQIDASTQRVAASEIKLFIMATAYDEINKGTINESDISNDLKIMIQNSDNDAANRLIDKIGMNKINQYIADNGYVNTRLNRKMLENNGTENYVSAKDVANLLEKIYDGSLISKAYSDKMLTFLKNQTVRTKIPQGIPNDIVVANKTGELSNVENDAAIVYAGGDYIIVVLSDEVYNTELARTTIKDISKIVYDYYT